MNHIQSDKNCSACGACMAKCSKRAISLSEDNQGFLYPTIDKRLCVSCGACVDVCICDNMPIKSENTPTAYISSTYDKERYDLSASGGIFGTLASVFIKAGGVVYGSSIIYENSVLECKHIRIDTVEDIHKIQGSKYVHSDTRAIFDDVCEKLNNGQKVLFSGTSCQVAALKKYLKTSYDNLFTVDLVCHGVPPISLFQKYISYIEKKYKCTIYNVSFRRKSEPGFNSHKDSYVLTLYGNKNNKTFEKCISNKNSGYYRLFLSRAGYRPNCYSCPFARITKEGDMTLGDFVPRDFELDVYDLSTDVMYSTILINNDKGKILFQSISELCDSKQIGIETVLMHHTNLSKPSICKNGGKKLMKIEEWFGFAVLERYIYLTNFIRAIYHFFRK